MEIELARIFVKVILHGSFTRAAEQLRLPKSTVSRAVSRLERETGTRLLVRTTRSFTLTAAGRVFFETCAPPVQILEEARRSLDGRDSMLAGLIRLTAPEDLGSYVISSAVGRLTREHPGLAFELNYTDAVVDLVRDGYDLAVRIGRLNASAFKSKRLGDVHLVAVASPDYLKGREKVAAPVDLASHDCLGYRTKSAGARWPLRSRTASANVVVRPRIVSNQMSSLVSMAVQGAGIAFVPYYLCRSQLESRALVRVLPAWAAPGMPVSLISPLGSSASARQKLVADRLGESIRLVLGEK